VVTQVPSGKLTSVEQSLVEQVGRGEWLEVGAEGEAINEAAMRSWGDSRIISATVIRDILRGRLAAGPDPHGLRLRGARIAGRLDLENLTTDVNLELKDCLLDEGILARDAHLASVALIGCQLEHPAESPLDAGRLTCRLLELGNATISGHAEAGAVRLLGAHIGNLVCEGASLRNDSGPALFADSLQIDQDMNLRGGFTATGAGGDGAVRLASARIGGSLECDGADLRNDSGPALHADGLEVGQAVFLRGGFTATGAGGHGAVRLLGANIRVQLDCGGADLRNDSGPALHADGLEVGQAVFLSGGFTATGAGDDGAVRLLGAHIGGSLDCVGAELRNDSGPALFADGLQAGQAVFLSGGFTATGGGDDAAVRLLGAHIGGSLDCDGAVLRNDSGSALAADGLEVRQAVFLRGGFTATGADCDGAVRLLGANIRVQLDCGGAVMRNDSGPALHADGLEVGQDVFLRGGFTATGAGGDGAVRLASARIGGSLECGGAVLRNDSGPALAADGMQVDQGMDLRDGFAASGGGAGVAVDLIGARVGGTLYFDPARLEHAADPQRRLAVDGLTYLGVPKPISAQGWLDLLRDGTPGYAAQPYQQLAAGYRAAGGERQARKILMAQRDDQLTRIDTRLRERLWGKITKVTLGYGYQPWRALLFLAAVVVISCLLAVALGSHGALAQTSSTATPGRSCTVFQQVSVGLDLNLPAGTSLARAGCDLTKNTASVTAAWLTTAAWMLRLLAWAFAALFIAGFTSAVRKT
jgi:hypothetical protein